MRPTTSSALYPVSRSKAGFDVHDRIVRLAGVGDDDAVGAGRQRAVADADFLFRLGALDELADLVAERAHGAQQVVIGRAVVAREELDDADDPAVAADRKREHAADVLQRLEADAPRSSDRRRDSSPTAACLRARRAREGRSRAAASSRA